MPDVEMPHLNANCFNCTSLRVVGRERGISLCLIDGWVLEFETRSRREAVVDHARLTRLKYYNLKAAKILCRMRTGK